MREEAVRGEGRSVLRRRKKVEVERVRKGRSMLTTTLLSIDQAVRKK